MQWLLPEIPINPQIIQNLAQVISVLLSQRLHVIFNCNIEVLCNTCIIRTRASLHEINKRKCEVNKTTKFLNILFDAFIST